MKKPALQIKQVGVLRMAFRALRETGPSSLLEKHFFSNHEDSVRKRWAHILDRGQRLAQYLDGEYFSIFHIRQER